MPQYISFKSIFHMLINVVLPSCAKTRAQPCLAISKFPPRAAYSAEIAHEHNDRASQPANCKSAPSHPRCRTRASRSCSPLGAHLLHSILLRKTKLSEFKLNCASPSSFVALCDCPCSVPRTGIHLRVYVARKQLIKSKALTA